MTQKLTDIRIDVSGPGTPLPGLQALLAKGFSIEAQMGGTLADLLCLQLGIDPDYLKNRVQTLFLNGSPVDDPEKTIVTDGDVVALSAAMPGLVGATMRKGGFYAKLRQAISYRENDTEETGQQMGTVTIRLFNVVARELGPAFLERGVMVDGGTVKSFLKLAGPVLASTTYRLSMDGEKATISAILDKSRINSMAWLKFQTTGDD